MRDNNQDTPPRVRDPETSKVAYHEVIRVKIRVDFYPADGILDYSIIGWQQPRGELLLNQCSHRYDANHIGMAPLDLTAHLWSVIRATPEPFP